MTDYKIITQEQVDKLLDSPGKKYEPIGLFLYREEDGNVTIWTAIDNSTGDAWTEEFGSRHAAVMWLHGYRAKNIYGEVLGK